MTELISHDIVDLRKCLVLIDMKMDYMNKSLKPGVHHHGTAFLRDERSVRAPSAERTETFVRRQ